MEDDRPTMPLFTLGDDGTVTATAIARGPWDPRALHGGPVAALAARALEGALAAAEEDGRPPLQPARFTLELERPVGLDPVRVAAEVTRPGRSVRTAEATIGDLDGRRLARATLVAIRTRPEPLDLAGAVLPADAAPPGPPPRPDGPGPWVSYDGPAFHLHGVDHAFVLGGFAALGPAIDWIRLRVPVVAGEEPSALQRVVAAADFGNGVSAAVPHATHTFINPDLTVTLHRLPEAGPVALQATTRVEASGIGTTESVLWDWRGRIGAAVQTLVVGPR